MVSASHAQYTPIDLGTLPGGEGSFAIAINNQGDVAGVSDTTVTVDPANAMEGHAFLWRQGVMTDLGTLGGAVSTPTAISARGEMVGESTDHRGNTFAFLWWNGTMTNLGGLGGGACDEISCVYSTATAINARGEVFGNAYDAMGNTRAFKWSRGVMTDLGALPDSLASQVSGVNSTGSAVGAVTDAEYRFHPAWWHQGTLTDLAAGTPLAGYDVAAVAINNKNQVAIVAANYNDLYYAAFLWDSGVLTDLGTLGGKCASPRAINERGQVIGEANGPGDELRAFVWDSGVMTDLGFSGYPLGINSSGQIVGYDISGSYPERGQTFAFSWQNGAPVALNLDGLTDSFALAISDSGQVAGGAVVNPRGGRNHAILWKK